jgi:DNA replication protein DnaC
MAVAKSKIDETLKKIAASTSKASSQTSSNIKDLAGDPNCKQCGGLGYLRPEVEPGHPDFGRLEVCVCRRRDVAETVRERLFSLSHLDELEGLTFETFQPSGRTGLGERQVQSLEVALNQAKQFAASLQGWLLLQGPYGCGKTHLAAAVANFAVGMGVPTLFLTVPDLLDMLRFSYDAVDTTFEERFNEIRTASLLVLDDFGTQNATGWAQEKLFQIVNYRYINKLPLLVTTNLLLDEIEPRLRSRLADPELVTSVRIFAPDFRQPVKDTDHPELSSLELMSDKTFGKFDDRAGEGLGAEEVKSLGKALKAANAFAEKPKGWLVFMGGYGCGKTHLAAAIANYRASLRATFSPKSDVSYDHRFDEIRTTSLLVLDDLGTQSMTPWVREKLYQLFNYRYNAELPTVITTADSLDEMDARIRSRLLDSRLCTIYGIALPGYHGDKSKRARR